MHIEEVIDNCLKISSCEVEIRRNEPMKDHTTFKVGGNADFFLRPIGEGFVPFCASLLTVTRKEKIPVFILGGGANIVVSDKGMRGIVLDMSSWKGKITSDYNENKNEMIFRSGTSIDEAADAACADGLCGLEFLAGMPGTIGGAVWMNARCYSSEIADVLSRVEFICRENDEYLVKSLDVKNGIGTSSEVPLGTSRGFAYKKSPFQTMDCLILSAAFNLKEGDKDKILCEMNKNKKDRQEKGHYLFPCAGSAFKNNHDFGKPTGLIIDELGLKGYKIGGAQIAPFHGNIIINTGNASAVDIRALMDYAADKVKSARGITLESEIIFAGDWS